MPSLRNAGLSVGILSSRALKGCSSRETTVSPPRPGTVTGAISQSKPPSWLAAWARSVDATAKRSWASRLKPKLDAQASAYTPIARPPVGVRS